MFKRLLNEESFNYYLCIKRLKSGEVDGIELSIEYVETEHVIEGVECDIYTFSNDTSRDITVVRVRKGHKTPLQRIVSGNSTIERFIGGAGTFNVTSENGVQKVYEFPYGNKHEINVEIGDIMQWAASEDLTFLGICTPPYIDGRFENLD